MHRLSNMPEGSIHAEVLRDNIADAQEHPSFGNWAGDIIKQYRRLGMASPFLHRRVCRLCHTGALGDEGHMLLKCPALADLRDDFSFLIAECSGVMARLVWARNQPMVSRYIIACLDRMSC